MFWMTWLAGMSLFNGISPKDVYFFKNFVSLFFGLPIYLIYTYVTVYWFLPEIFLKKRNYIIAAGYILFSSLLYGFMQSLQIDFVIFHYLEPERLKESSYITIYNYLNDAVWVNIPLIMFASIKYIRDYSFTLKRKNELLSSNVQAELSLLKVQLKPHFLFNTLNNLYSLALEGSPKTSEGIERVTNLLHTIVYECSADKVELFKEINLIRNYLELEKIRYDSRLRLDFQVKVSCDEVLIAPMILFTFVENCFKHGSSKDAGPSYIIIELNESDGLVDFRARNSKPEGNQKKNDQKGLGLNNVKMRLNYLYPEKYKLNILESDREFSIHLKLNTRN